MRGGSGPRSHLVGRCPLGCRLLTPAWELSPVAGNGMREGSVYTGPSAGYDVQRKGKRPPRAPPRTTGFPGHAVLQGIARPRGLVPGPGRGEKSAQRDCNKTLEFQARCHRPALAPPLVSPSVGSAPRLPRELPKGCKCHAGARKAFVTPCPVLGPQAYCDTGLGVPEHQDPNEKTVNLRECDREGRRARAGPLPTQSRPRDPSR